MRQRALLVGAGGAGSAISWALVEAGVAELAIHDIDTTRRDGLIQRLAALRRHSEGEFVIVAAGQEKSDDLALLEDTLMPKRAQRRRAWQSVEIDERGTTARGGELAEIAGETVGDVDAGACDLAQLATERKTWRRKLEAGT